MPDQKIPAPGRSRLGRSRDSALWNHYLDSLEGEESNGNAGGDAEDYFYQQARDFDPRKAVNEYAQGAYQEIFNGTGGVGQQLDDLRGRSVGSGRLDTGFFDRDSGEVMQRGQADLNSRIAQQSTAAAGMNLSRINSIGDYGANRRSRYLDMLSGGLDREQAAKNASRKATNDTLSTVGQFAGLALGFL